MADLRIGNQIDPFPSFTLIELNKFENEKNLYLVYLGFINNLWKK